jgi:hypothetical protein
MEHIQPLGKSHHSSVNPPDLNLWMLDALSAAHGFYMLTSLKAWNSLGVGASGPSGFNERQR